MKTLAEESTVVAMARSTSGWRSTESSWRIPAEAFVAMSGTRKKTGISAIRPSAVMTPKVARQPKDLADQCAERDTEDVGERQAREHQADRARLAVGRHHPGGDHGADAEERAVREGGEDAREHQERVVRRYRGEEIADDEDADHHQQHALARHAVR